MDICKKCLVGSLDEKEDTVVYTVGKNSVPVKKRSLVCNNCGAIFKTVEQELENRKAMLDRKLAYGKTLLGEEIVLFRRKYGLTQRLAAKLIGKGIIAFSRYERETSYPDKTTNKLIRLAMDIEEVAKWLATDEELQVEAINMRLHEKLGSYNIAKKITDGTIIELSNEDYKVRNAGYLINKLTHQT
jgi:putative zinc finger/helix-turn-helix YgiT family protein